MIGRVLIVEDDTIWRERLIDALQAEGYEVHSAASLEEARQLLYQVKPDVVTLDMTLRYYDVRRKQGYALLEDLDVMPNGPEVIIVSNTINRDEVRSLWQGYDIFDVILKTNYGTGRYFIQAVRDAVEAKRRADAEEDVNETSAKPMAASEEDDPCPLTEKEKEVLREVARGKTNKEIAQTLQVSINTIKRHLFNITKKFETPEVQISGRINLVNKARELGCIPREE